MKRANLIVALVMAVGSTSAFSANTDRDAPSSNALFKPSNQWVRAPDAAVQEQERIFDLDRAGFPQYSPL